MLKPNPAAIQFNFGRFIEALVSSTQLLAGLLPIGFLLYRSLILHIAMSVNKRVAAVFYSWVAFALLTLARKVLTFALAAFQDQLRPTTNHVPRMNTVSVHWHWLSRNLHCQETFAELSHTGVLMVSAYSQHADLALCIRALYRFNDLHLGFLVYGARIKRCMSEHSEHVKHSQTCS